MRSHFFRAARPSCAFSTAALSLTAFLVSGFALRGASKASSWQPIAAAELAETAPKLEPEAPAEALFVNIEIDDNAFPFERTTTEYIRYKIFRPDKVEHITRISGIDNGSSDNKIELRARLTLPDGTSREFGQESIKERTLARQGKESGLLAWLSSGGPEVKEKFLAISGVEAGAVLEYRIIRRLANPPAISAFVVQREGIPLRQASYLCRISRDDDQWGNRTFALNLGGGKLTEDKKKRTITVTAENLPSIIREPFVGPATDYALTIVNSYERYERLLLPRSGKIPMPGTVDPKSGPWAVHSTLINWIERDRGYVTPRVKQLAAEITMDLADPEARARAIHTRVQNLYQQHRRRSGPRPAERVQPQSLDDIMDVEKKPEVIRFSQEFVWLAVALYRTAGFECHTVMLPDRTLCRFNPQFVSPAFLANFAVTLKIGDQWRFSSPHTVNRLPFGLLPWEQEAQAGLLALEKKQQFIKVPATRAEQSVISSTGKFSVDAEGVLTGECTRTFTGQAAVALRGELRRLQKTRREEVAATKFGLDAKVVDVKMTKIDALDDAEKPLLLSAKIRWPGFATRTKNRLLLHPEVFRAEAGSPFTATERRHPIHFPYPWQEHDRLQIQVPAEFEPESPSAPAPNPGEILNHEVKLSYDRANHTLHGERSFTSHLLDVAPDRYPVLKTWYDRVARADQHEIVFLRKAETPAAEAAK
ncbi:MAG: hypothetical protein ABIQ12_12070 [Opitutaceae bacterium]